MEVYRICSVEHSKNLMASGAPNRWNRKGEFVIYTAESRSLSTLELIVHRSNIKTESNYKILTIEVKDSDNLTTVISLKNLPKKWRTFEAYSTLQEIGSEWYNSRKSLILKVPSSIIPQEYNYAINTQHPDFKSKVKIVSSENYFWDERLL